MDTTLTPPDGSVSPARTRAFGSSPATGFAKVAPWLVLGVVLASYGWTCVFGFVNDDFQWVEQAAAAVDGYRRPGFEVVFFLRPVVELSFLLNYLIAGSAPFLYHVFNLALEALNAWLVWRFALLVADDLVIAMLAAIFFTIHPSHPGAVTWVCGRAELISTACFLGALLQHRKGRAPVAAALLAVGIFARESAVSFPLAALWLDLSLDGSARRRWRAFLLYAAVLALYAVARSHWTSTFAWQYSALYLLLQGDWTGMLNVISTQLSAAVVALLEPLYLNALWASVLLFLLVAFTTWSEPRRRRAAAFSAGWTGIALLPFIGWATFHPRYAYLPGVGFALLLALSAARLIRRPMPAWRLALAVVLVAGWATASMVRMQLRNEQWRRNGVMSERVLDAVVKAVPKPQANTVFVIEGIGAMRLGRDPWAHTPVLLYGLGEALRLRFADHSLDISLGDAPLPVGRPVARVQWDGVSAHAY